MKREQQQAQAQMALQLLQMLREGRNQSDRIQLAREQMNNEMKMGSERDLMMQELKAQELSQQEQLANAERAQAMELAKLQQAAAQQQQTAKSQAMMDPQILDYLQRTMEVPPGAERDALMANLEQITGKTYQRPVDQFQQLVNPNK